MLIARKIIIAVVLLGMLMASPARAQRSLMSQVTRNEWAKFGIVGGRVTYDGAQIGNYSSTTTAKQRKEVLTLRNENGQGTFKYERTTEDDQLVFDIAARGERFSISHTPLGKSAIVPLALNQVPNEKITLTLGSGAGQQTFRADGIWQLLITPPAECRQRLISLLEMLRPNWKLAATVKNIEENMLHAADNDLVSDRARWDALVAQLADESFAKREAADRALRVGDSALLAYLRQLDFSRLDAEQQFRIRRIIDASTAQSNDDSAEQVAASLAGEPLVWLALLERPELADRQTAARKLAKLLGEPIPVDPAADPKTQENKREQLRAKLEGS